ncbi:Uncharacterized conserved protein, DUF169 family [Tindallia magadiensis]|uniref:Uncharacterized conserved protein, DUF169 family n=1 Tax=Tindallia magadiensis TaxID=69895 RepID=A0A1I3BU23_9FIRM|nr:Uncharacterized conserved protein, DUF169 family [Tindallia magadiensis]
MIITVDYTSILINKRKIPVKKKLCVLFESLLSLDRKPIGVKFLLTEDDYEASTSFEYKSGMPYCTAIKNASKGSHYKMNMENSSCVAASRALGFTEISEESLSGSRHEKLGVYKNLCISRSVAKDMVYCQHRCTGVEIKPLDAFQKDEPDVVVMVTSPYNAMRIVQGYAYHFGQLKNIKMAGMCAICQECTSYPYETNSLNISMLCSGTRCVGQWSENELGIGFPYHYFESIVEGLIQTTNPMEDNKSKKKIAQRLSDHGLASSLEIKPNDNYYRGAYGTPKQKEKEKQQDIE